MSGRPVWGILAVLTAFATGCAGGGDGSTPTGQQGRLDGGADAVADAAWNPESDAAGGDGATDAVATDRDADLVADAGPDGAGDDGPPDAAVDVGPDAGPRPARLRAAIVLTREPQAETGTASVAITEPIELQAEPGCRVVQVDPDEPAAPAPRGYDGGTITISGVAGGDLTFTPQPDPATGVRYAADRGVGPDLFADEAVLRAVGAGGPHFAPFEIELRAPPAIRIESPREFGERHDADDPLAVRWTAAESDSLLLLIIPTRPFSTEPERGSWAFCSLEDNGSFEVPPEILEPVARGGAFGGRSALVVLTRTRIASAEIGADEVVFTASVSQGAALTLQ